MAWWNIDVDGNKHYNYERACKNAILKRIEELNECICDLQLSYGFYGNENDYKNLLSFKKQRDELIELYEEDVNYVELYDKIHRDELMKKYEDQ